MISKSQIKLITSLAQKKYRQQHGLFLVEGLKGINEFLRSNVAVLHIYALEEARGGLESDNVEIVSEKELRRITMLKNPQGAIALCEIPKNTNSAPLQKGLSLMLDEVRDPGNLGTIIRLCDWFGVERLICSEKTVDCYNPKVVQASMGSLSRITVDYVDLDKYLIKNRLPVYGAFMDGKNLYKETLSQNAILILGNEAKGISKQTEAFVDHRLTIPQYGGNTTESLNVATAGAILMSAWRGKG